jgi:hypothetical protein
MSDPSSSGAVNTGSPKQPISPARHIIGLIVLAAVVAWCWFEYSALSGYNAAVTALDSRLRDENKALPPVKEAETLIGKAPDGPGSEITEGNQTFTQKTYTWRGLVKSHTLTAYYTKEQDPCLHHMETEGAKYQPEPVGIGIQPNATIAPPKGTGKPGRGGMPSGGAPGKLPTEDPKKAQSKTPVKAAPDGPAKETAKTPSDVPAKGKTEVPDKDAGKAATTATAKESVPEKGAPAPK